MIVRIEMDKKNSVNFNYNKFVGYYDVYSDLPYPNLEIRKDKKGNYYLLDYGKIGESIFAKDNTIYLQKLKKIIVSYIVILDKRFILAIKN